MHTEDQSKVKAEISVQTLQYKHQNTIAGSGIIVWRAGQKSGQKFPLAYPHSYSAQSGILRLGFSDLVARHLTDPRGKNTEFPLVGSWPEEYRRRTGNPRYR